MWSLRLTLAKLRPVNATALARVLVVVTTFGLFLWGDYALFRRLPGVVIGLLFAALALAVHLLLANGPRPNIYFSF